MKKRYILSILIALCLLIVACVGVVYAKYASEKKAENLFLLSSNVKFETYTYAIFDEDTGALSIRNREAFIKDGKLIERGGTYDIATEVYALPSFFVTVKAPENATTLEWNTTNANHSDFEKSCTSVSVDDTGIGLTGDLSRLFQQWTALKSVNLENMDFSAVTSMHKVFDYCTSLTSITFPKNMSAPKLASLKQMFYYCTTLESVDLSGFDTSAVTTMEHMFEYCTALKSVDVSSLETTALLDLSGMFWGCSSLKSITFGGDFTTSNIKWFGYLFYGCSGLVELDLSELDTTSATDMTDMFWGCSSLTTLTLGSNFKTSNVTSMRDMFNGCSSMTNLTDIVKTFDTSKVENMGHMFHKCTGLTSLDLSTFDTSSLEDTNKMFGDCINLVTIYVSDSFVTDEVTSSGNMFNSCSKLTGGNGTKYSGSYTDATYARIDGINGELGYFTGVVQPKMDEAADMTWSFNGTGNFNVGKESTLLLTSTSEDGTLPGYVYLISSVEGVEPVFAEVAKNADGTGTFIIPAEMMVACSYFTIMPAELYTYAVLDTTTYVLSIRNRPAAVLDGAKVGEETGTEYLVDAAGTYELSDNGVIYALPYQRASNDVYAQTEERIAVGDVPAGAIEDGWSTVHNKLGKLEELTNSVTFDDTVYLQGGLYELFQQWPALTSINMTNADFTAVTNAYKLFDYCTLLETITFSPYLNTAKVTNMQYMFYGLSALTGIDLSGIDTDSVTTMANMFEKCTALTSITFGDFEAPELTTMAGIFNGCTDLESVTFGNITAPKLITMRSMFNQLMNLTTVKFGERTETPALTNVSQMFYQCQALTSISFGTYFDTSAVQYMNQMFWDCKTLQSLDVSMFDTSKVTSMYNMFGACSKLQALDLRNFDTSNVIDMSYMFSGCRSLSDLKWDTTKFTTAKVTDMSNMFATCYGLTNWDLSHFDTSNVTDMSSMFNSIWTGITTLDLSNFDTSNVENMSAMFKDFKGTTIIVSDKFVTAKVTSSDNMFQWAWNLTGSNGTNVRAISDSGDDSYHSAKYAIIDGANSQPGYFTAKINDLQLTLNVNDGSESPVTYTLKTTESSVTIPKTMEYTPVKDGHVILGWATSPNATEPDYKPGTEFTFTDEAATLYAVWDEAFELTITSSLLETNTFVAGKTMTWQDWCDSVYNTVGLVAIPNGTGYFTNYISKTINGTEYVIYESDATMAATNETIYEQMIKYSCTFELWTYAAAQQYFESYWQ